MTETHNLLGVAALALFEFSGEANHLRRAKQSFEEAVRGINNEELPLMWAGVRNNIGILQLERGIMELDTWLLKDAVATFNDALELRTRKLDAPGWAATHHNLGIALTRLGWYRNEPEHIRNAIGSFHSALEVRSQANAPLSWADTQLELGIALTRLNRYDPTDETTRQAVIAFESALAKYDRERRPLDWSEAQNGLGTAHLELGILERDAGKLREASATFHSASQDLAPDDHPLRWAAAQLGLGRALAARGWLTGSDELVQESIRILADAVSPKLLDRDPLAASEIRRYLADILVRLGREKSDAELLLRATNTFRSALGVQDEARVPAIWLDTSRRLGQTLTMAALATKRSDLFKDAAAVFEGIASREWVQIAARPFWGDVQHSIGENLLYWNSVESHPQRLRSAAAAFREALVTRTRDHRPADWSRSKRKLGRALTELALREDDSRPLQESIEAYRDALEVLAADADGADWAETQIGLGNALRVLHAAHGNSSHLREASRAFEAALTVLGPETDPKRHSVAARILALVRRQLAQLQELKPQP